MNGTVADLAIVVIVVGLAAFGYRSGLLKAGSALLGLIAGLAIGVWAATLVGRQIDSAPWRLGAVVGVLVILGNLGYVGGMVVGERLRRRVRRPVSRGIDRAAGGIVSTVVAIVLVWMVALPLASSPVPAISQAVRGSVILPEVDKVMPHAARSLYAAIDSAISAQGLPDVVGPLEQTEVTDVGQPDAAAGNDPEVVSASASVVKVVGEAPSCSRLVDGSGFVYEPERVVTNAHVVAGTDSLHVETPSGKREAHVVYADEHLDIAILRVDGLTLPALPIDTATLAPGADVVVAGYPGGGDLSLVPGKVRAQGKVTGPSFRKDDTVSREVVVLRGEVIPGDSGGPLLDLDGEVVGVIFGAAADQPDVGYALSAGSSAVTDALAIGAASSTTVVTGECYP